MSLILSFERFRAQFVLSEYIMRSMMKIFGKAFQMFETIAMSKKSVICLMTLIIFCLLNSAHGENVVSSIPEWRVRP